MHSGEALSPGACRAGFLPQPSWDLEQCHLTWLIPKMEETMQQLPDKQCKENRCKKLALGRASHFDD